MPQLTDIQSKLDFNFSVYCYCKKKKGLKLNSLVFITEAIMSQVGETDHYCHLDKIYEYVAKVLLYFSKFDSFFFSISKRWKTIRRRDGSTYTTDYKRAVRANLRHNPHHMPLFKVKRLSRIFFSFFVFIIFFL